MPRLLKNSKGRGYSFNEPSTNRLIFLTEGVNLAPVSRGWDCSLKPQLGQ